MAPKTRSATRAAASSTIIRVAFFAEALGTVFGVLPMIFKPENTLQMVTPKQSFDPLKSHPASLSDKPSPQALLFVQWFGAASLALTTPLFLGASDNPRMVATRRMTYITLGAGELSLIAVMLLQMATGAEEKGMVTITVLMYAMAILGSLAAWRAFVLIQRPDWFDDAALALDGTPSGKRRSL